MSNAERAMSNAHPTFLVSITGLRIKPGLLNRLRFTWHAVRSFNQARKAKGNLHVAARAVNGVQHTVTAWESREAMLVYIRSGAHLEAMKAFHRIAEGSTFSMVTERLPDWEEAHRLWKERGAAVRP
jgi:hypothetical protein